MRKIKKANKGSTLISKACKGFTLIELLVVISVIGVLIGISIFGLQGARQSSRDSRRKADLELIRSGLELYRSDCDTYPIGSSLPSPLVGDNSTSSCLATNTYIQSIPIDPTDPARTYLYSSAGITYELCTSLESGTDSVTCGGSSSCGETCNYKVTSP